MTLRARLLLALLILALLPTLAFTLFTTISLSSATKLWYLPQVDRALEAGVEVSRTALTRVEANVLARADEWAATSSLPLTARRRAELRDGLRLAGLDFVQVYTLEGGHWTLADQVVPAGVLAVNSLDLADSLATELESDRLIHSRSGVLAGTARAPGGEAVVTGIRLTPDFFARIQEISQAREKYGQLGVVVESWRRPSVWLPLIVVMIVLVPVAFLLARALSGQMTEPLREMANAFERVAAGQLDARVPEEGALEVRQLASSFNAMTVKLADARSALVTAEREAAWRDVARRLAHEIKNPLTPMRLSLHRLQKRAERVPEADRAAVRDSLDALLQEVEHLTRLAEHFSQFARLPEPQREPLDLGELARAAAALHEPDGVRVRVQAGPPVRVDGDPLLLSRALHNLLLNACEASRPGSEIEVVTGSDGNEGWVEVLDRGPGLDATVAARVFDPYVSTKNRGSGLGLSLVRDVAAQHGGRATLDNREDGGARARLVLPLSH